MKRYTAIYLIFMFSLTATHAQKMDSPLIANQYLKPTTYNQLSEYVQRLDHASDLMEVEVIGQSIQKRNLYALKFSTSGFGKDKNKIKVLFFAQQHGNEQSGKEGALLLAKILLEPENRYLFDRIDFALIPQVNPDGSEVNQRRNAAGTDLNRNHLILTEPETRALHHFFEQYMFEASMDIHEYSPYISDWETYGYRKNAAVTLGTTTNVNISKEIREFSNKEALPYVLKCLNDKGFSSFVYCPGGPPEMDYIRHSTFDINDGRQSLGILNSFSFIQEGMNGEDDFVQNLQNRSEGQATAMRAMLEFIFNHQIKIKKIVGKGRKELVNQKDGGNVSIQADHFGDGRILKLPLVSWNTKADTIVEVKDYRPVVKSICDVRRPIGYLIPKSQAELINWLDIQSVVYSEYVPKKNQKIEQYFIKDIDSIDFEHDIIVNPIVEAIIIDLYDNESYVFVPVAQLKCNLIIQALEPKSMLGLVTYKQYAHLLKPNSNYPVIRVIRK
ncbi:MAG: M14 family zinc carboxypeptidase [Bacteroidales bacterium]